MWGAIAGDMIGSIYERRNHKSKQLPLFKPGSRFTDDTVLSVATAEALLNDRNYATYYQKYYARYPFAGYGKKFTMWATLRRSQPYNSFGNGSAMRVSPVGYAFDDLDAVLQGAKHSAEVTHNHPEGIKGAQATAAGIFLARTGHSKAEIQDYLATTFEYELGRSLDEIRPSYKFDVTCQGSVPQAIRAFLESTNFEDAIRNAISIGGDSDTIACIAGGIAEAFYGGVPDEILQEVVTRLDAPLLQTTQQFTRQYCHES
jgi:ADP-ribosylglycohydrolase